MKPILEITNIGKKYSLQHLSGGYMTLRERMSYALKPRNHHEDFWALKNISFDVQAGESLGIIGRNGAGKSTLLKILSKITVPTTGKMTTRGRIASLLEVGTGFHPELSGRENVFFNGSLLGMRRNEIKAKFDEIVDFSGVEKFLDTALKHYSSGMQLRLAFAVAAFLEPEILIIDEVLAVGDADFQRKCLGKMEDVHSGGRTILFVSHNLDAVESLCQKCIRLEGGSLIAQGASVPIIRDYLAEGGEQDFYPRALTPDAFLDELSFTDTIVSSGDSVSFKIQLRKTTTGTVNISDLCLLFYNYKKQRTAIFDLRRVFKKFNESGSVISYEGTIGNFNLIDGVYNVGVYYKINNMQGDLYDIVKLQVRAAADDNDFKPYEQQYRGFVNLR
jgi:lipopolysaccharide transport system ATP-binding protein